ncbi:MAG TPA: magnesium chelatase [Phycisphaerae bacterium]
MNRPSTVRELRASGYRPRSVKQEMRENLIRKLRAGEPLFPGIIGYDDSVIPQVANAVLSRHDLLFLGLRGQAKTRMIRALPSLLDEFVPTVAGAELPDDPLNPQFASTRVILARNGDDAELHWIHRDQRYHEKLATPDVTIADLIGEIDLVKHAEGRYLSDESVLHYGLIPRTNRGIFAINELPDLAPRIQVGLFNVLEERDVQIRGFPVRLPLDVCLVFSANPEDYTNRGRIVTPLKDRIGSVVRTHYPTSNDAALQITRENAWLQRDGSAGASPSPPGASPSRGGALPAPLTIAVPPFMLEIVEEIARLARKSPHINQQSGVSVRLSIANAENLVSNAERRAILCGEARVVPRISDLDNLSASCRGKIELMLAEDESAEEKLITSITGEAVKGVFSQYGEVSEFEPLVEQFTGGKLSLEVGDDVPSKTLVESLDKLKGLKKAAAKVCDAAKINPDEAAHLASAAEFVLEALYVNNRLSKYAYRGRTFYKR